MTSYPNLPRQFNLPLLISSKDPCCSAAWKRTTASRPHGKEADVLTRRNLLAQIVLFTVLAGCGVSMAQAGKSAPPVAAPPASAQPAASPKSALDPLVHLTKAEAGQFQAALDALAGQGRVALIAEGTPLIPELLARNIPDLTADAPLEAAVGKIALAYDYDVQRQGKVFVLTKRYTNPKDLPSITLEECDKTLRDVARVFDAFNPHFPTSARQDNNQVQITAFAATLSPAQEQAMQAKTLRYGTLSSDQQGLLMKLFLYQYVQTQCGGNQGVPDLLGEVFKSALTGQDRDGCHALCMEETNPEDGSHYLNPLSGSTTPLDQPQPAMILADTASAPMAKAATLGQVMDGLKPVTGDTLTIQKALRAKTVTVAGLENASSKAVMKGLAVAYGLHIGVTETGPVATQLERMPVSAPNRLRDLSAALWATLPAPLVRASHVGIISGDILDDAETPLPGGKQEAERDQVRSTSKALQEEAIHRLVVALQPQFRKGGLKARIPTSSLDEEAHNLLALALTVHLVPSFCDRYRGWAGKCVFNSLDNMNQTIICGKPEADPNNKGKQVYSLFMWGVDPTERGQYICLIGTGSGMDEPKTRASEPDMSRTN